MSERNLDALWVAALLAALAGCQSPSSRVVAPGPAAPAEAQVPVDPSFDWHVLVIAPFGSVLKDVPRTLHEVLLFRDQDPGATAPEDGECYAADVPAPQFVGHIPDEYMLCFKQDRLSRIQATVRLPGSDAAAVFAAACAGWLKSTAAPGEVPNADARNADAQNADACQGRDGGVHFNAHLEREAETARDAGTGLTITLDGAAEP
jgi:hypothetical protein